MTTQHGNYIRWLFFAQLFQWCYFGRYRCLAPDPLYHSRRRQCNLLEGPALFARRHVPSAFPFPFPVTAPSGLAASRHRYEQQSILLPAAATPTRHEQTCQTICLESTAVISPRNIIDGFPPSAAQVSCMLITISTHLSFNFENRNCKLKVNGK